ncbi:MAG: malto-oligosyltrehalose synthase, partial [Verrucomicrobiota bacterium]
LVKLTAPGVPDIYQGCELWDFSLVDPDNRRPVDFALRQRLMLEAKNFSCDQIWKHRSEGLPKLRVIRSVLNLRARRPELFAGGYQPLPAKGAAAEHLVSFLRGESLITVVPRFLIKLKNDWQDTLLPLPPGNWHHEFTGEKFSKAIQADRLFQKFPVALLIRKENE